MTSKMRDISKKVLGIGGKFSGSKRRDVFDERLANLENENEKIAETLANLKYEEEVLDAKFSNLKNEMILFQLELELGEFEFKDDEVPKLLKELANLNIDDEIIDGSIEYTQELENLMQNTLYDV